MSNRQAGAGAKAERSRSVGGEKDVRSGLTRAGKQAMPAGEPAAHGAEETVMPNRLAFMLPIVQQSEFKVRCALLKHAGLGRQGGEQEGGGGRERS